MNKYYQLIAIGIRILLETAIVVMIFYTRQQTLRLNSELSE